MIDEKLIKLAVDGYHNRVAGNYSVADSQETIRKALRESMDGDTRLNFKKMRDGAYKGTFQIIETLIEKISEEGLHDDEMFTRFIEDRNVALGDSDMFHVEKDCLFAVADIAEGTQGVRRQRFEAGEDIPVKTQLRAVKIYEELNRVLSGRIDFNEFVDRVGRSFTKFDLDAAYAAWTGMFDKLVAPYAESGTYDEGKLMDLCEHVEAATGATPIIVGTKKALRKITTAVVSDHAKDDMYMMGHYGRFNGYEMVSMKQRHDENGTFILPDNCVYVFAAEGKPVKRVTEGEVTMIMGNPQDKADLSQEFLMLKRTGVAVVMDREYGVYKFSN